MSLNTSENIFRLVNNIGGQLGADKFHEISVYAGVCKVLSPSDTTTG